MLSAIACTIGTSVDDLESGYTSPGELGFSGLYQSRVWHSTQKISHLTMYECRKYAWKLKFQNWLNTDTRHERNQIFTEVSEWPNPKSMIRLRKKHPFNFHKSSPTTSDHSPNATIVNLCNLLTWSLYLKTQMHVLQILANTIRDN